VLNTSLLSDYFYSVAKLSQHMIGLIFLACFYWPVNFAQSLVSAAPLSPGSEINYPVLILLLLIRAISC